MDHERSIRAFLRRTGWLSQVDEVAFLASGEYNQNYLISSGGHRHVLRINRGSQLGLGQEQIAYEFGVLTAVAPSGVTPRPSHVEVAPPELPGGTLLMEYLPGTRLNYHADLEKAAAIFAAVHALTPSDDLLRQDQAVADIAAESLGLIQRYEDHPRTELKPLLLDYHRRVLELNTRYGPALGAEGAVMVNTEVNSGNFIVGEERAWLVDWEKAVVSCRYQDLGHFLVPTTTRWKADVVLTPVEKEAFLAAYHQALLEKTGSAPSLDQLAAGTEVLERTILLRALSWCYMAYYEYTRSEEEGRAIKNPDTFAKITAYLDEAECFLA